MIFAHAPLVVRAIARVRVEYTPLFYVLLGLLHASLAWHAAAPFLGGSQLYAAGLLNAAAILAFLLVLIGAMMRKYRH